MTVMPDINTLVATAWPNHVHHQTARRWLLRTAGQNPWATCAIVQSGFLRISMNNRVVSSDVSLPAALHLLTRYTSDAFHTEWTEIPMPREWPRFLVDRVQGYRQVTDATLLATVMHHDGILVTLDAGILSLLPGSETHRVQLIVPEV